jgi:TatD DNase family protein
MAPEVIDSHLHLDAEAFDADRAACIERAVAAGVTTLISIGAGYGGLRSAYKAIELAEAYPFIWATVGVHPHDADDNFDAEELQRLAQHPKVVALGETGLDFFKTLASPARQYEAFKVQIEIARSVGKPLVIHSRNAAEECLRVLQEGKAHEVGGVFHCYAENAAFAARLWQLGFYVSFPGTLTFKKADNVRATCAEIPLEQILIETDSPYMAPEPLRGKRCEPAFVVETAKKMAAVRGITFDEVARVTHNNTHKLFSTMSSTSAPT